jgi:hypothetical protein
MRLVFITIILITGLVAVCDRLKSIDNHLAAIASTASRTAIMESKVMELERGMATMGAIARVELSEAKELNEQTKRMRGRK